MTQQQALDECYALWTALAKSGDSDKLNAIYRNTNLEHLSTYIYHCPCCEYSHKLARKEGMENLCTYCPIWNTEYGCEKGKSPYYDWSNATIENRRFYAQQIADLALEKGARP